MQKGVCGSATGLHGSAHEEEAQTENAGTRLAGEGALQSVEGPEELGADLDIDEGPSKVRTPESLVPGWVFAGSSRRKVWI